MHKFAKTLTVFSLMILLTAGMAFAAELTVASGESIQEAIDEAQPGDTVLVEADTYSENLVIKKPLTLRSVEGPAETVIEPEDPSEDMLTVDEETENVTIDGFTVRGGDAAGIVLTGSHHKVINNVVEDVATHGVIPIGGQNVVISNNVIAENRDHGIFLWGTANVTITNNRLEENAVGIELTEGATGARVHFNDIVDSWTFAIVSEDPEVDATFNWWGEGIEPEEWVTGQVDTSYALEGPAPEGLLTLPAE